MVEARRIENHFLKFQKIGKIGKTGKYRLLRVFKKEYKRIKNVSVVPKVVPENVTLSPIIGTDILI